MERKNYQQIGLVIALIVAGVSLPTAIVSSMNKPTIINNYYNTYYNETYYEENYYGGNETQEEKYNYPLIREDFSFNSTHSIEYRTYIYNASNINKLWVFRNQSDIEVEINVKIYDLALYNMGIKVYEKDIHISSSVEDPALLWFEYMNTWVIEMEIQDVNINFDTEATVFHKIVYID